MDLHPRVSEKSVKEEVKSVSEKVPTEVPVYKDPFRPVFKEPVERAKLSTEQLDAIRDVLRIVCSDSRFVQKAEDAFYFILTGEVQPGGLP